MKKEDWKYLVIVILWFTVMSLIAFNLPAQTIGTTKTEDYKASFEKKSNISCCKTSYPASLRISAKIRTS